MNQVTTQHGTKLRPAGGTLRWLVGKAPWNQASAAGRAAGKVFPPLAPDLHPFLGHLPALRRSRVQILVDGMNQAGDTFRIQVPWTRIDPWPAGVRALRDLGFIVAAFALDDDAMTLDALAADPPARLALVVGTEGDGLARHTVSACDLTVRIPMAAGVDSLNVASAAAVALWAVRVPPR